jgi:hypothetical protein
MPRTRDCSVFLVARYGLEAERRSVSRLRPARCSCCGKWLDGEDPSSAPSPGHGPAAREAARHRVPAGGTGCGTARSAARTSSAGCGPWSGPYAPCCGTAGVARMRRQVGPAATSSSAIRPSSPSYTSRASSPRTTSLSVRWGTRPSGAKGASHNTDGQYIGKTQGFRAARASAGMRRLRSRRATASSAELGTVLAEIPPRRWGRFSRDEYGHSVTAIAPLPSCEWPEPRLSSSAPMNVCKHLGRASGLTWPARPTACVAQERARRLHRLLAG